jgi:hypothetical protein
MDIKVKICCRKKIYVKASFYYTEKKKNQISNFFVLSMPIFIQGVPYRYPHYELSFYHYYFLKKSFPPVLETLDDICFIKSLKNVTEWDRHNS